MVLALILFMYIQILPVLRVQLKSQLRKVLPYFFCIPPENIQTN